MAMRLRICPQCDQRYWAGTKHRCRPALSGAVLGQTEEPITPRRDPQAWEPVAREAGPPTGNMVLAAFWVFFIGLFAFPIGLIYSSSADQDKKVFGKQMMAWAAGWFLFMVIALWCWYSVR